MMRAAVGRGAVVASGAGAARRSQRGRVGCGAGRDIHPSGGCAAAVREQGGWFGTDAGSGTG